jgi:L-ectoine synthase
MIIRDIKESVIVDCPKGAFRSHRFLTESDGMGYTLTKTVIPRGGEHHWHYKKHLEACLCVSGSGIVKDKSTGEKHWIFPWTMYALNNNDAHTFEAIEDTVLICVFNPPLKGNEVHKDDGSY